MRTTYPIALSGLARKMAEQTSDFAGILGNLIKDVRDCYRPGLHEMREAATAPGARRREAQAHAVRILTPS